MKKSVVREYFESLVIAVALALFARTFVFQAFKIPTGSMEKNLLIGDHLIVNKMVFSPAATGVERALLPSRPISRGDIIVFKYPKDPARDFIKRVIGLPGDRLELKKKKIYINDKPLDEPYVQFLMPAPADSARSDDVRVDYGPVTVPAEQYFMMATTATTPRTAATGAFYRRREGTALFIYLSVGERSATFSGAGC